MSVQDQSDNATRHQLVQMLMRGLIRKHGIPAEWIELQFLVVPGKKQGLGMYVHLVIKQWDVRLMNHAQAFQDQLLADIKRYEPKCGEWLHGMSWKLKMSDTCPYATLPEKPFWAPADQPAALETVEDPVAMTAGLAPELVSAGAAVTARNLPENDDHAKLERLFAIRDREASKKSSKHAPPSFEDTQPFED